MSDSEPAPLHTPWDCRWAASAAPVKEKELVDRAGRIDSGNEISARFAQTIEDTLSKRVGRLAGGVAHDFNNLLTIIVSYSDLVKEGLREGRDVSADVDEIKKAGERAVMLTRQLLASAGRSPWPRRVVDVNAASADGTMIRERAS